MYLQSYSTSSPLLIANERIGSSGFYSKAVWFDLRCERMNDRERFISALLIWGLSSSQFPFLTLLFYLHSLTVSSPTLSVSLLSPIGLVQFDQKILEAHQRNYFPNFIFPGSQKQKWVLYPSFFVFLWAAWC